MAKKLIIETVSEITDNGKIKVIGKIILDGKTLEEIEKETDFDAFDNMERGGHSGLMDILKIDERLNFYAHLLPDFGS